jgi:EAL domain-containing protein (putative c-di-GMP-specific phosphodiesterase class I)
MDESNVVRLAVAGAPAALEPGRWRAAQAAAVAEAEAIAATEAAEVAAEAASTALAAVNTASAAAVKAAARARAVAAQAVSAAAAAADEAARPEGDDVAAHDPVQSDVLAAVAAAAKVAGSVAAVAAAAAKAATDAATFVCEQLVRDAAATAAAVTAASSGTAVEEPPQRQAVKKHIVQASVLDDRRRLIAELRAGIGAGQLRLHYQPVFAMATRAPVGVEALVRWQHPTRGLLAPVDFIEVAERTGLVIPLGDWVVREACRAAAGFLARYEVDFRVGVNLSAMQLSGGDLVGTVREALRESRCAPGRLIFEITETAMFRDRAVAVATLMDLKELGVRLAIDDFGTGYATLQYLSQLPADSLKIEASFVAEMGNRHHGTALVASLVSLAHNMDVRCVAEGVETREQLRLLAQVGCDFAQGYLLARPMAEQQLTAWLDARTPVAHGSRLPTSRFSPERGRILAMCQGGASPHSVAAALNAEGSRTAADKRWSSESVAQVMSGAARRRT